jgi:membrane protein implicated in regulation of membrane protease activity
MISFRTVIAFMVGFGWAGAIALEQGLPVILAIAAALAAGTVFMVVVYWLMRSIYKLSDSGNVDLKNAAGQSGTVYLPVPPAGKGMGQVQVTVQGRLREMSCVTDGDAALPTGVAVRVVKVLDGGTAVVRRVEVGNE